MAASSLPPESAAAPAVAGSDHADYTPFALDWFQTAMDAAPTGMLVVDGTGRMVFVNRELEKVFGYTRDELLGQRVERLVSPAERAEHAERHGAYSRAPSVRPMGMGRTLHGCRKDGALIPVEIGLTPLHTPAGPFVLASVIDISARRKAELERESLLAELQRLNGELEARVAARTAHLSAALREREVLLREVHHRVKNNLYVVSSLLAMQGRRLTPGAGRAALEQCQTRVLAIALIHEKLYESRDLSNVSFSEYVRGLAAEIFHAGGTSPCSIELELHVEPLALAVDKAIPCALILNELITNALRHAFPEQRHGRVRVELAPRAPGLARLVVQDDGVGLPEGFTMASSGSLGHELVSTLTEQLEGQLTVVPRPGARFELVFPVE